VSLATMFLHLNKNMLSTM